MKNEAKQIIPDLYNSLTLTEMAELKDVLMKVYRKLDEEKENPPLINRLVNYIYFTGFTNKLHFTQAQEKMIHQLSFIGRTAGLNGVYRSNYADKSQF